MTTVTTIIPTYRRPRLLERAIRSVLHQTFSDFRVCVYDNASGDETEDVVRRIATGDPRVVYYRHPSNVGATENFLFGMRRVDTPYFSFLSDDDVLFPNFYASALSGFDAHPEAMMSIGSTLEFDEGGELQYVPLAFWKRDGLFAAPAGGFQMLNNRHPTWTSILFRRELLDSIGFLDLQVGAPADLDYELRAAARFPIVVSFEPCGAYVRHAGAASAQENAGTAVGFEKIVSNLMNDEHIALKERLRFRTRLTKQIRFKLLEICVKSLLRGDDATSREAAAMLGRRYGRRLHEAALNAMIWVYRHSGAARAFLRNLESARLSLRARASRSHVDVGERALRTYAAHLGGSGGVPQVNSPSR